MNSLALIIAQVNLKKLFIFTFPLFLVLGSLALFLVSPQSEIFNTEEYSLISNIVFFNQAHILLTFFLIFSVDHFKFWRKTSKVMGMPVDVHMAIAFMVFFFVVLTFFYDGFAMGRPKSIYLYFYLYQIIGLHHFLYQSFGFSSHLSRGYGLTTSKGTDSLISNQVKNEKFAVHFVFLSFFIVTTAHRFFSDDQQFFNWALGGAVIIAVFSLGAIVKSILELPDLELKKRKLIFSARYLLYPFNALSPWLAFAAIIIHGWEYIYFTDHAMKQGHGQKRLSKKHFLIFLVLEFIFIVPLLFINSNTARDIVGLEKSTTYFIMAGLVNACILCHFYMDRMAFSRKYNSESHRQEKFNQISIDLYKS